jgi:hypothetical protein
MTLAETLSPSMSRARLVLGDDIQFPRILCVLRRDVAA